MNITLCVDDALIKNAIQSAFESGLTYGIGYWAKVGEFESYDDLLKDGSVTITEVSEDEATYSGPKHRLCRSAIQRGLKVMSSLQHKDLFAAFLKGEIDGPLGDVFIQCCVLGKIKYG